MKYHQTNTRKNESKEVDFFSIVRDSRLRQLYVIILCNKEMKFIELI